MAIKRPSKATDQPPPKRSLPQPPADESSTSAGADHLDDLLRQLAGPECGSGAHSCAAYASTSNLLALPVPPPSSLSSSPPFPLFPSLFTDSLFDLDLPAAPPPTLRIGLTHLASPLTSAVPAASTVVIIPNSSASSEGRSVTHLSFSPDGEQLLCVSSDPSGEVLTLFEHQSPCLDDGWNIVLHERLARLAPGSADAEKKVVTIRWVGEPRRWYPTPTFPDAARESSKKPLYCAPARSAPLSGTAFVAVLSSDELLFLYLPAQIPLLPRVLCMPLHPHPHLSPSSTSAPSSVATTRTAIPTPPTPLPSSSIFAPSASTAPTGAMGEASPQATMDALVTSLVSSSASAVAVPSLAPLPLTTSSSSADIGLGLSVVEPATPSSTGGGAQALRDELAAASASSQDGSGSFFSAGQRRGEVVKAAIGAARSRAGGAEIGETVFVVATYERVAGPPAPGAAAQAAAARRRKRSLPGGGGEKLSGGPGGKESGEKGVGSGMVLDVDASAEDFSLLADFTSLDEAFGGGGSETVLPTEEAEKVEEVQGEEVADEEDREGWERWAEDARAEREERTKWRVRLSEVRIEMAGSGEEVVGRLTIRPQAPLYLSPSSSSAAPNFDQDTLTSSSDPLLTHLTFLGDVSLPHALSSLSSTPSASSASAPTSTDGTEAAVDLCLLAVLAHPSSPSSSSSEQPDKLTWKSTLSTYPLSHTSTGYALSEAFSTLESASASASSAAAAVVEAEGETGWAGRLEKQETVEGVVSAVEIRPGGGEWGGFKMAVLEEQGRRTRVRAMDSVTLLPFETEPEEPHYLPASHLYFTLLTSPSGGLLLGLPFSPSPFPPPKAVLTAPPIAPSTLATLLALSLVRQSSASDLTGRTAALGKDGAMAVLDETREVLERMLGEHGGSLEGSALGWELLGVSCAVYRGIPSLHPLLSTARRLLSLASFLLSFSRVFEPLRSPTSTPALDGSAATVKYRASEDALWPLVAHVGWLCENEGWVDELLGELCAEAAAPEREREEGKGAKKDEASTGAVFLLLHPLSLDLLLASIAAVQAFHDSLVAAAPAPGSTKQEEEDDGKRMARVCVVDIVRNAAKGGGLEKVREVLERVKAENGASTDPSPLSLFDLSVPPHLAPKVSMARAIVREAFGASYASSSSSSSAALPTPPRSPARRSGSSTKPTPSWEQGFDVVRRSRLSQTAAGQERRCVRCGRRTRAGGEGSLLGSGKWSGVEEGWEGRCGCGGGWVRNVS